MENLATNLTNYIKTDISTKLPKKYGPTPTAMSSIECTVRPALHTVPVPQSGRMHRNTAKLYCYIEELPGLDWVICSKRLRVGRLVRGDRLRGTNTRTHTRARARAQNNGQRKEQAKDCIQNTASTVRETDRRMARQTNAQHEYK